MIIKGKVIKGDQKGHKQGYPTANLNRQLVKGKISKGVYACLAHFNHKKLKGILIYGAPDKKNKPKLEIYLLAQKINLYGKSIAVEIIKKIRPLKKFKSKKEFLTQAKIDIIKTKKILKV